MPTRLLDTPPLKAVSQTWRLKLDAELTPDVPPATFAPTQYLAELLARRPGVSEVTAKPHCAGRCVYAELAVEATNLTDAIDRAAAYLRSSALAAGLGSIVLVAEGVAPQAGAPTR